MFSASRSVRPVDMVAGSTVPNCRRRKVSVSLLRKMRAMAGASAGVAVEVVKGMVVGT